MKLSRSHIAPAIIVMLVVSQISAVHAGLNKGEKAPTFKLKSINGKTFSFDQIRKSADKKNANNIVLLDFWATWCPPCREEVPHLQRLHEKYGKKGLIVVGVTLDRDGLSAVKPFVKRNGLTYTILIDPKGDSAKSYKVFGYPTTYIIDRKGNIHSIHIGYMPGMEKQIENEIKSLLNK